MTDHPVPGRTASVIVRSKNKQDTIRRTLDSLATQSVRPEIIVVDSGSTDGTLDIARELADSVVQITPEEFTYGRALNIGAARSSGEIIFALSAHCAAAGTDWVASALSAYEDPDIAGTIGDLRGPDGSNLAGPTKITATDISRNPLWGFSNHASSWRRDVWEDHPFDEQMIACEDKEWMWRVLQAGYALLADPHLDVPTSHRRDAGLRALFDRVYREHLALAEMLDVDVPSAYQMLDRWWSSFPYPSPRPRWLRRLSPWRNAELAGEWFGSRAGAARRRPDAIRFTADMAGTRR